MKFKEPKIFGKNEDGFYLGRIEDLGRTSLFHALKDFDGLYISNRKPNLWVFSLFNGYRQVGTFLIKRPHDFKIGDLIIAEVKDGKIINVNHEVN